MFKLRLCGNKKFTIDGEKKLWCVKCGKPFISIVTGMDEYTKQCDDCNLNKIKMFEFNVVDDKKVAVGKIWLHKNSVYDKRLSYVRTGRVINDEHIEDA